MSDNGRERVVDMKGLINQARAAERGVEPNAEAMGNAALENRRDELPPLEEVTPLPLPGDPYKAHAMPVNQPQHMLCLLFRGVGFKLLSYGNLDCVDFEPSTKPGEGPALVLLFGGLRPVEVRLTGKNVRPLGSHLRQHRIAWVREHPDPASGVGDDGMIITSIHTSQVKA